MASLRTLHCLQKRFGAVASPAIARQLLRFSPLKWMKHLQAHRLWPSCTQVTITQPFTVVNPLRSLVRPGYTQTDDTQPKLGWGGANVGLLHVGRIPNCSEVPGKCFFEQWLGQF